MTNTFSNDAYRSAKMLSYFPIGFLSAMIGCFLLMFILSFLQIVFTTPQMNVGNGVSAPVAYVIIGLVSFLIILLRLLTIVFFLIWEHRAFKNLPALGAKNLEFSPAWAVGWWFIPFADLVKPYQAIAELWNASDSDFDPELFLSNQVGTPSIIGWWWAFFIVGNIVGGVSNGLAKLNLSYFLVAWMVYCVLQATSAFLIIIIVRKITREQESRFEKLGSLTQFSMPPLPPAFD